MPDSNQKVLEKLMGMESDVRNNVILNTVVKDTVGKILESVNDDNIQLKVNNLRVEEKHDNKNIADQKDVRNKGQIWSNNLRADLQLIDKKTGTVVDKVDNMKVADIPKLTDRGTFLIGGIEYQFTKQARLKPGVYTKHQTNGEISSFFNVDKTPDFERGFNNNFKLEFDPEKKVFQMAYGSKHIPLINALRTIGIENKDMERAWGKDVFDANAGAYDKSQPINQNKFYEAVFGHQPAKELHPLEAAQQIKDRLFATELDPAVTKITLGHPYKNVNKDAILDASKKIIDINRGKVEDDDREALIFKSFHDVEDHIREKLIKNSKSMVANMRRKLNKNRSINKSLSSQTFNPSVVGIITSSQLSSPPNQTNPMSIIGEGSKFTVMGEGGIGSTNAVTNETRQISNSEMGFVDPLHSPEGSNIGIAVHTSMDTVKIGGDLYSKFIDKHGKTTILRPIDVHDKNIAFPDQFEMKNGKPHPIADKVKVVRAGKLIEVNKGDVDFIIPNAIGMFDTSANSIPFLDSIQGNRGLTASKMQEQALSLKNRSKPLFKIIDDKGNSLSESLAGSMALPKANIDGTIKKISPDKIIIHGSDGKEHEHHLYNEFSLNSESFLHNEPVVKEGDKVKKGDLLADNNFTKDGQMALGTNLRVAYVPYRGFNFEDSAIMSESAAKKLTSQHMYDLKAKKTSKGVFSANKFKAYYPEEINSVNSKKLDSDGVVKVGQKVERGDVVIAHLEKKSPTADDIAIGRLDKQLKKDMADHGVRWEKDHVGVVTDVKKSGNSVVVNIKTEEPLQIADKISGLHGNKHIISKIVPDEEMPYNAETGERIDLTMSPIGVSNRINTSQLLESAAGKIANKTGKQYNIRNFSPIDNSRKILEDLKAAGLSDKDVLMDPMSNKPMKNSVANGIAHILKLEHKVDHKYSARYREGYDANEQPATGGETGSKNLGRMEMGALLARGANENIREMMAIKGQRNDEYWKAMETGQSLPPPKKAFVWDKTLAMLNGSGINVEQKGKTFTLKPMTDKEILEKSKGEILKPTETYRVKDLAPIKEGLFDPAKAGGVFGEHYTHFKLPEKVLNPITASAAANLVDLPLTKLEEIIDGKKFVDKATGKIVDAGTPGSISGSPAVELMLGAVNVKEHLKQATDALNKAKNPTEINRLNKKIKYLTTLEKNDMKPTDYLISHVLVVPSKYRPVFSMGGSDGAVIMSDINNLYQQTAHTANSLSDLKKQLKESVPDENVMNIHLAGIRGQLYQDLKVVTGLQEPTSYLNKNRDKKGFISQIDGGKKQTKEGFFQDKVLDRQQDMVGRSTIILNPDLGGDEIGIPRTMASKIFSPFIMKKMVSWGYSPLEAQKHISDKTPIAEKALDVVADERLVIANRAPTIHRWNMTAFKPKLTTGKSIEVPAIVVSKNFGGDFDGDTFQIHVPISNKALAEAEKMKPSASMLKTGYDEVLNKPSAEIIVGSWLASKGIGGKDTGLKFSSIEQARAAFKANKIDHSDTIQIDGIKAPYGMHEINSVVPDESKRWGVDLNSKNVDSWIRDVTKKHNGKMALGLADKIKDVGNQYVSDFGYNIGVSDTLSDTELRDRLIREAEKKSNKKNPLSIIQSFFDVTKKGQEELKQKHGEKTMLGIGMQSGGSKGIGNTSAITFMPGILEDANNRPIPIPVTRSYSEGLDTFGYWTAAHGARSGNIQKSVSSSKPGWMTKDMMNSLYETRIKSDEPVDTKGLEYNISDKKGITNRFLARDVKTAGGKIIAKRNDMVDSDMINKLNQHGVKSLFVQSPLTDPTPGDGFSSWSYGVDYNQKKPNIGDNIGVISAHTITEPSINMAMKAFHTGGAIKDIKKVSGTVFDQMWNTLKFTKNLPDKATLASMDGKVKDVKQSSIGGWDVTLDNGEKQDVRYIHPNNELKVKKGDKISAGDALSTGEPSPHDLLKYKGMPETQKFLVDHIHKLTNNELDKRDIETVVRGITNTTRIMDPGTHPSYIKGDVAPLTTVEHYNDHSKKEIDTEDALGDYLAENTGRYKKHSQIDQKMIEHLSDSGIQRIAVHKSLIKHEPFLTPTGIQAKASNSEDWIARLAHNRIAKVLEEGTTRGWKTEITPTSHPLPMYVTGEYQNS